MNTLAYAELNQNDDKLCLAQVHWLLLCWLQMVSAEHSPCLVMLRQFSWLRLVLCKVALHVHHLQLDMQVSVCARLWCFVLEFCVQQPQLLLLNSAL